MMLDHIFRGGRIAGAEDRLVDIGLKSGRFAAVETSLDAEAPTTDLGGRLVLPGLVETHIHLDKSRIMGRCDCGGGTLGDAVAAVARAKRDFTEEDVYTRAAATLERAIPHGTNRMRTHVEVDPRIGLTGFRALRRLKRDYAWAIDLQLCCFPQEGLIDDPGCDAILVAALEDGADLVGGAPYIDREPHRQIGRIFDLARRYDLDVDLHLDFSLDPASLDAEEVCRLTDRFGWGGRVAIGHATKLSALPANRFDAVARRLADAGVAVTVLPATDLYLGGRDADHDVPRGVAPAHRLVAAGVNCSVSTNNVLNPFTPYGDGSVLRVANLFANVAQVGTPDGLAEVFAMVSSRAAALMRLTSYAVAPGESADFVVLDCASRAAAVAEIAPPLMGFRAGRRTFSRPAAVLHARDEGGWSQAP